MHLSSIHIGKVQTFDPENPWTSAIVKSVVKQANVVKTKIEGDEQADLKHHGGVDKAVLAFFIEHYDFYRNVYPETVFENGGFGENFAFVGGTESDVCVGDTFRIGETIMQVSQPRMPCFKLARRFGMKDIVVTVQQKGFTGFYLRVLQEGRVQTGDKIQLIEQQFPKWTIAYCNELLYRSDKYEDMLELSKCPVLAKSIVPSFEQRAEKRG